MAIRRLMMMGLTNYVRNLMDVFRSRVRTTFGVSEADSCLYNQLDRINQIDLLDNSARIVVTPNAYNEGILHKVIGPTITSAPYNLQSYTEIITGGSANLTLTTSLQTDPFGNSKLVNLITETAVNNSHRQANQSVTVFQGKTYTISSYLKKGSGATAPDIIQLTVANLSGFYANFDINTGVVTLTSGCTATIDNIGLSPGWWRCSITITPLTNSTVAQLNYILVNNNPTATLTPSYLGVTTSNVFFIGLQFEEGSVATAYQPIPFTALLKQGYAEFTRSTTATRIESSGMVREVPQENLFPASENMLLTNYSKTNLTIIPNTEPSPITKAIPMLLNDGAAFGRRRVACTAATPISIGDTLILSVYAKKAQHDWIQLCPVNANYELNDWANFNLNTGTIGNKGADATAYIENIGNGWYRCSLLCRVVGEALQQIDVCQSIGNIDSGRYPNHTGTGQDVFYICGASLTRGSTVQPYYPTYNRTNTPRIDYTDGNCPTILMEQAVTNLLLRSEEFDTASWTKSNLTVTPNTEIAPNGLMVADTLTATSNGGYTRQNGSTTSSDKVWSVYIKRKTGTGNVYLESGGNSTPVTINNSTWTRCFNLSRSMSSTFTISSGFHTITTSSPHRMITGDSIRINITSTTSGSGAANVNAAVTVTSPTTYTFTSGTATATGTCTTVFNFARIVLETAGDEIYVWGGQLEGQIGTNLASDSEAVPSSYVPTTNATVTKAADNLVIENPNSNQKTFYFNLKRNYATNNTSQPMLYLGDGPTVATSTTSILCIGLALGVLNWYYKINSGSVVSLSTNTIYSPNQSDYFKVVITADNSATNKFNIWMNGVYLVSSSVAMDVSLLNYTFLGNTQPILRLKEYYSWDRVLTNTEINDLFSYPYYNAGYTPINSELQHVINRAYYEGFTLPSSTILSYCDTLITEMKNDGVWSVTDLFLNFAFNDVGLSNFSRINWKQPNSALALATLNGGLIYQTNGFKGNGTDAFINTNYRPTFVGNYVLNNAGRLMVLSETGSSLYLDGVEGNSNNSIRAGLFSINSGNSSLVVDNTGTGLRAIMRYSSSSASAYNKSVQTSGTLNSTTLNGSQQLIHRSLNIYGDTCISNYYLGASLTSTQIANFRIYYNQYLTNIGLTAFA